VRSLADQTVEELGGRWSILHRQKQDHVELDTLLERLPDTSGEERDELLNRICRLVFTHAFAEEAVLWPALRRSLEDGEELTARVEREHQEITELVARLEQTPSGDPERAGLVDQTVALLREDVRDEEDLLLPRLQAAVDNRTLRRLGVTWELVRRTAPTRTHPIVSRRPPGQTLSALPLSLTDRMRDGLDHAARRVPRPARPALVWVGNRIGAVAAWIEQLPPLRRGERPETHVPLEERR
jgi:hemerythrin superfamily protein